jgi:hypothetical protein
MQIKDTDSVQFPDILQDAPRTSITRAVNYRIRRRKRQNFTDIVYDGRNEV